MGGRRAKAILKIERAIAQLPDRPGQCLHYTHQTAKILTECGYKAVIQAGSLQWPRLRPEEDDGQVMTHFAYMWDFDSPESKLARACGQLPEMHIWVGLLDSQEIVDFSVRHLPMAALERELFWTAPVPPRALWTRELPAGVVYTPCAEASVYAGALLKQIYDPVYLRR
jgi:hypothetical protein